MRKNQPKHIEGDFVETAVAAWGDTVYRVALSQTGSAADAEDVRQDVFERLLTSSRSFANSDHLKAWLLRVTVNRCRDLAKSHSRSRTDSLEDHGAEVQQKLSNPPEEDLLDEGLLDELNAALQSLPTDQHTAINLFYREGLTTDEIADAMQCSPGAVRTRLYRARNALRNSLAAALALVLVCFGAALMLRVPSLPNGGTAGDSVSSSFIEDNEAAPTSNDFVLKAWAEDAHDASPHQVTPFDPLGVNWLHPQYWQPNYNPEDPYAEGPVELTGTSLTTFNFDALCTGTNLVSVTFETTCDMAWFSYQVGDPEQSRTMAKSFTVDYQDETAVRASEGVVINVIEPESPQIAALIEQWANNPDCYWNDVLPAGIAAAGRSLEGSELILTATFEDGSTQTKTYRIGLIDNYDERCREFVQGLVAQWEKNEGLVAEHEALPRLFTLELVEPR